MLFVRRLGRVRALGISDWRLRHTRRNFWHSRSCNGMGEGGGGGRIGRQIMGKNSSYSEELTTPILESVPVRWWSDVSRLLLRAPRGFGKFYPKGAQNVRPTGRSGTRLKKGSSGEGGQPKGRYFCLFVWIEMRLSHRITRVRNLNPISRLHICIYQKIRWEWWSGPRGRGREWRRTSIGP